MVYYKGVNGGRDGHERYSIVQRTQSKVDIVNGKCPSDDTTTWVIYNNTFMQ